VPGLRAVASLFEAIRCLPYLFSPICIPGQAARSSEVQLVGWSRQYFTGRWSSALFSNNMMQLPEHGVPVTGAQWQVMTDPITGESNGNY